jgi:hypothetical protein
MNDRPDDSKPARPTFPEVELDQLDLRYEGYRLKAPTREGKLLASIAQEALALTETEPLVLTKSDPRRNEAVQGVCR